MSNTLFLSIASSPFCRILAPRPDVTRTLRFGAPSGSEVLGCSSPARMTEMSDDETFAREAHRRHQ
jgi:hypothetical protein